MYTHIQLQMLAKLMSKHYTRARQGAISTEHKSPAAKPGECAPMVYIHVFSLTVNNTVHCSSFLQAIRTAKQKNATSCSCNVLHNEVIFPVAKTDIVEFLEG